MIQVCENLLSHDKFCCMVQGIIFLVHKLLCIFDMTAIQDIFCVAVFFHRSVQNFI